MLKIYNSLTREKQTFTPIEPGKVRMYVCGMTVYDFCHLGHARVMVVFDMVARWYRASEYQVTYVRNITDIDDKIIKRANENGETIDVLTQRFIDAMDEDSAKLGIIRPDIEPRATQHIQGMLDMIAKLIEKGHAYQASNGDVFYKVRSFNDYGKLSGKSLDDLRAGERVEVDTFKQDPLDFVLWKSVKPNEPNWDSPWGKGRPGWHIECSVMSAEHLGAHFDIHGGGQDLQFPHHENEIAQSEAAHSCQMANYWMHNGFVRVDDEKMSKSLGNFFTIREVLSKYDADVVRFFILRAHYRSPLNYSDKHLDDAKQAHDRFYLTLKNVSPANIDIDWENQYAARFKAALDDDFNTPEAMAVLFDLANEANKTKNSSVSGLLKKLGGILGLLTLDAEPYLQGRREVTRALTGVEAKGQIGNVSAKITINISGEEHDIQDVIQMRLDAKKTKNFAEADRIRKELADAGIILEDTPQGTTWRRA
ncbi:cysteine--tRNA ligase [Methylotenera sp. N17]|uniref:cysteine--tRNA ligase n=1 Tax=Methylotenera sp. N17 TaxID=1502761 RepID=UPI000645FBB6|nr:cysteine--tRNA ligase [Methylotenera sp. N17]